MVQWVLNPVCKRGIGVSEHIAIERDDGVLVIRIERPEKKNALTAGMYGVMAEAMESAGADPETRVILFTGSGGTFTAGNDLGDFLENPPRSEESPVNRFIGQLVRTDLPLVAAVDGIAVGIGTTMLLHCDHVFASDTARFSLPFINLALVPEAGSSMLLAQACGYRKAAQLLMLGEPFDAVEAKACGIVSRLCPAEDLLETALWTARKLAAKPQAALRATKHLMRRPAEPLAERVRAESERFVRCLESEAAQEAFAAFLEKRQPDPEKLAR